MQINKIQETLKNCINENCFNCVQRVTQKCEGKKKVEEALNVAQFAISTLLIAKAPDLSIKSNEGWYICPNPYCRGSICAYDSHRRYAEKKEISHCEHCGQAIQW